jgi:putative ABC transport system permease protein
MLMLMAFRAMCHHTLRSLLTLLGIVIGITGIIAISAIGKGAQVKARDQWLAYGAKSVFIASGSWMSGSGSAKPPKPLTIDDIDTIKTQCPAVQYITPFAIANQPVEYAGKRASAEIRGQNENALLIGDRTIQSGTFFTQQQVEQKENVVVLSPEAKEFYFQLQDPLGAIIRINNIPFTVIGVLTPPKVKGKFEFGPPEVAIPFTCHQKYFGRKNFYISLSAYSEEQVAAVVRQLEKIFRVAHTLEEGEPNDFTIQDSQTYAAAAEEASKSVSLFSLIAAIIALLVGGIGVMNIMLVAVQERTKEIGIKAALGATRNVIRLQFLIEAVAICVIGGIIGVALGAGAALALNRWFGVLAILELTPILVSLFFTAMIGLVFGLYPAEKAARLNPVEALTEY